VSRGKPHGKPVKGGIFRNPAAALLLAAAITAASCSDFMLREKTLAQSKNAAPACKAQTYITPNNLLPFEVRFGVFTIRAPRDAQRMSAALTEHLQQTLIKNRVFRVVEIIDQAYDDIGGAMDAAARLNYDLILLTEARYIASGGELRQSMISLKVRVLDPQRRMTLMNFEDCEAGEPRTGISLIERKVYNLEAPAPEALGYALVERVAKTVGKHAEKW
jgi:hypothetical protein